MFVERHLARKRGGKGCSAARFHHQPQLRKGKSLRRADFIVGYGYARFGPAEQDGKVKKIVAKPGASLSVDEVIIEFE